MTGWFTKSPVLFNILMDEIIKSYKSYVKKIIRGYRKLQPVKIAAGVFADHITILIDEEEDLQLNWNLWN